MHGKILITDMKEVIIIKKTQNRCNEIANPDSVEMTLTFLQCYIESETPYFLIWSLCINSYGQMANVPGTPGIYKPLFNSRMLSITGRA